jgi:hypothetical protein
MSALQPEGYILQDREVGKVGVVLKHKAAIRAWSHNWLAIDEHLTRSRRMLRG